MRDESGNAPDGDGGHGPGAEPGLPWLLPHKVEVPDPVEGYVERPELEARCTLTERRLTVLHAPGGFGKTALLARRCRALRDDGVAVAWLSLDEEDGPGSVAAHLELAFARAGVESSAAGNGGAEGTAPAQAAEADSKAGYRIDLLLRAIARHGAPCVLALDEVERLRRPEAVAALDAVLRRAPAGLHVGMACRERPPGLDVATPALEGRAETLTVDDLRFSEAEMTRFFGQRLPPGEFDSVAAASEGWPIALRIHRNAMREGGAAPGPRAGGDLAASWIETRLWRGIPEEDRGFVLDMALFDRIEPDLVREAAGFRNADRRVASMEALSGLFSTAGGDRAAIRLHPLVKEHCERRRFEEDPERFRALHRAIAEALARRARPLEALRHATEAGDADLVGRIAERTGGVRLWLEEGIEAMRTVDRHLGEEALSRHPRLALLRCAALTFSGDVAAARRVYHAAAGRTSGFSRDRRGGNDAALQDEHLLVTGMVEMCGCRPFGPTVTEKLPMAVAMAGGAGVPPLLRGVFCLGICMIQNQRTAFDASAEWAERAREELGPGSPYLAYVDFQLGSIAMAQGRAGEARRRYGRALEVARASHLRDAGALMLGQVLSAELAFERSAGAAPPEGTQPSPRLLGECGAWLDIYAAHTEVRAGLALLRDGPGAALAAVDRALEHATRTGRDTLVRFLSALRVSVLLAGGGTAEAEEEWRLAHLPEEAAACIDLQGQGWREAETLSCARLRLLGAMGETGAARDLGAALLEAVGRRRLVRTSMRALAILAALERRAGDGDRARAHLLDCLRLFAGSGYARPLAREREDALPLLDELARAPEGGAEGRTAARLAKTIREAS